MPPDYLRQNTVTHQNALCALYRLFYASASLSNFFLASRPGHDTDTIITPWGCISGGWEHNTYKLSKAFSARLKAALMHVILVCAARLSPKSRARSTSALTHSQCYPPLKFGSSSFILSHKHFSTWWGHLSLLLSFYFYILGQSSVSLQFIFKLGTEQ